MAKGPRVLVVEDDAMLAEQLRWALQDDYQLELAGDRPSAVELLPRWKPQLVLLDLCMPPSDQPEEGFRVLRAAREQDTEIMVLLMSALGEREHALRAVQEGAYDFFDKPVDLAMLRTVMHRALERQTLVRENRQLRDQLQQRHRINGIIGLSSAMQPVFQAISRVADSPITVMIQGESGTGKELVARAIHHSGCRADRPFVPVHCAALPEHLREAELFGHEKGAFTGADSSRIGRFEAADGGTLFLDEVACLDLQTQVKLLRVLEDRAVERVGSNERRTVDIRLIAATNEDLHPKVERGEFRRDVFFRLNVFPIVLPPLRERIEDVPLLADHFLKKLSEERNLPRKQFSSGALRALTTRSWPGNVRELSNLVETVALLVDAEVIEPGDLPVARDLAGASPVALAAGKGIKGALHEFERQMLRDAIQRAKGVKSVAARELGLDANQMKYLVRKHHLHDD